MTTIAPRFGEIKYCPKSEGLLEYLTENTANGALGIYEGPWDDIKVVSDTDLTERLNLCLRGGQSCPTVILNKNASQTDIKRTVDFFA